MMKFRDVYVPPMEKPGEKQPPMPPPKKRAVRKKRVDSKPPKK